MSLWQLDSYHINLTKYKNQQKTVEMCNNYSEDTKR